MAITYGKVPNGFSMGKPTWGQTMPVIGSVAGSVIDAIASERANKSTARSAQAQTDFQREQSATAYQRAVKDLTAAGLNPGLAYGQGGASTEAGASYQARPNIAGGAEKILSAMNAYQQFATGTAQRELLRAQTEQTQAQTALNTPLAALSQTGAYQTEFGRTTIAELRKRFSEANNYGALFSLGQRSGEQGIATAKAAEAEARSRTTLNEQDFTNVWFRKNVLPYINSTAKTVDLFKPNWSYRK